MHLRPFAWFSDSSVVRLHPPRPPSQAVSALLAVVLLTLAGCAHDKAKPERLRRGEHAIRVNSTASAPVKPGTPFVVMPAKDPGAEATLLYGEAARLVKAALMAKGLYEAPSRAHAGVVVEIEYSMETPRVSRAAPGDPAAQTGAKESRPQRSDAAIDNLRSAERGPLEKNLVLTAREAKAPPGSVPKTLWSVEVSTTDPSNDLRKYLPLLAAASISQMGVDSDGPQTVKISETDKSVALIRQAK